MMSGRGLTTGAARSWRRPAISRAICVQALNASERPVRIVAHSMGGLVARAALAQDQQLWQDFKARRGCRLVMLGTPNGGSFSISMMLLGRNRLMRYLALLDFTARAAAHLEIVSAWPGVLQMLPFQRDDLFRKSGWRALAKADAGSTWSEPAEGALEQAERLRKFLRGCADRRGPHGLYRRSGRHLQRYDHRQAGLGRRRDPLFHQPRGRRPGSLGDRYSAGA